MELGIQGSHFIPNNLTKWHSQFLLMLSVSHFLFLQCLNFSDLFLHVLGLNFGYVSPHYIP
jgi:hypothetical protein